LDREQLFSVEKMAATISVSEGSFQSNNFDDLMQLQARDLTGTIEVLAISVSAEFRGSDCAKIEATTTKIRLIPNEHDRIQRLSARSPMGHAPPARPYRSFSGK
jgi:hypothetical protein